MKNRFACKDNVDAQIERGAGMVEKALIGSTWNWEHIRDGKIIDSWVEKNLCVYEGLDNVLDVHFSKGTQITQWYIAIFNNNHTPATGNTYAVPGFTEATNYSEGTRPEWIEAGPSSRAITNSASKASFTFTSAATIYGGAMVGGGSAPTTKNDQAGGGTLFNISQFTSGSKSMASSDVLKVTVALTIADA